jgi:hypothetical protein
MLTVRDAISMIVAEDARVAEDAISKPTCKTHLLICQWFK